MKKHKKYDVSVVLSTHTAHAICNCPAGLSGCCNHITATLYCTEEYFWLKLNEEAQKGCTEKLQVWHQSKPDKVDARPTNLVMLVKRIYGVEKGPKVCRVNQWDCRPLSSRKTHSDRKEKLRQRLLRIEQVKTEAATSAVDSAASDSDRKKAIGRQSMISKYGTSCFLQLFDNEPTLSRLEMNGLLELQLKGHSSRLSKLALLQQKIMITVTVCVVIAQALIMKLMLYHHHK